MRRSCSCGNQVGVRVGWGGSRCEGPAAGRACRPPRTAVVVMRRRPRLANVLVHRGREATVSCTEPADTESSRPRACISTGARRTRWQTPWAERAGSVREKQRAVTRGPPFRAEMFFAEMERPGQGAAGLEDKTRSNLLPGKHQGAGLGEQARGREPSVGEVLRRVT